MTSRERVLAAVAHEATDRPPVDYAAHPALHARLLSHLGLAPDADLPRVLELDLRGVGPRIRRQASPICYADPTREVTDNGLLVDLWGVGFRVTSAPTGDYVDLAHSPLAGEQGDEEIAAHPMMDPNDWDWSSVAADAAGLAEWCVWAHCRGAFEISWLIRGFEDFLSDLVFEPRRACGLLDRVLEPLLDRLGRTLDAAPGAIHMAEYNDDVGGQEGLLISPETWRAHLAPRVGKVFEAIRKRGVIVRYHTCGSVRAILPDLIDLGLEVLNPVQPLARGMDPFDLKREFGGDLTFHGGIDVQEFLPRARPDEVREGVARLRDVLADGGGWIACPSHAMQPDVPCENVVALYETLLGRPLA